ncbi:MAG: hypothetical protein ACE5K8_05615 [Candidatus Zixiibacteriota bacterium]
MSTLVENPTHNSAFEEPTQYHHWSVGSTKRIASTVYFGAMATEMKEFFDTSVGIHKHMVAKIGAAFAPSSDPWRGEC